MSWQIARRFSATRRWWAVALAMVVGALLAYAYGLRVTPVYEAKAILVVNAPVAGQLQVAAAQAPTYAELANSIPLLRAALNTLTAECSRGGGYEHAPADDSRPERTPGGRCGDRE